jgi:hypothetical protein
MIATTHTTRIPTQGTPALVRNRTIRRARWTSNLRPMR